MIGMKKSIIILVVLAFLGCDNEVQIVDKNSLLKGEWIWVESSGGIAGTTISPETTGEQRALVINETSIKNYVNGILVLERAYHIEKGSTIRSTKEVDLIVYEYDWKQSFEIASNSLILYDECYDCFQSNYIKK